MVFLIPDGTCSIFWKILILENYRIFEFFNFGKLGYYYYSKKGRYNPVVGGGVVVVTLGFCAGLPAGGKSSMRSLINYFSAGLPGRREIIVNLITNSGCIININIENRPA